MFLAVQVVLLVIGLFVMVRGRFQIGDREVTNPSASVVGIILVAQLPIALLIGIILGLTAEPSGPPVTLPTRAGEPVATVNVAVRSENDFWWVDPLITCGAVVLAAGMTGIAMRSADDAADLYASLSPADADKAP